MDRLDDYPDGRLPDIPGNWPADVDARAPAAAPAHGAKGTGRGVSARSGWRVNTARSSRNRF
ncbi:hypothetical protein AB0H86_41555, partial [Streptomyces sp. NPDC050997]